jgi:glycerol uptake facilitator-like aquaporin
MGQQHARRYSSTTKQGYPGKVDREHRTDAMLCCAVVLQGIWVSRPASYNPLISFLNEAVMTFMFLFLVNMMTARWVGCESLPWGPGVRVTRLLLCVWSASEGPPHPVTEKTIVKVAGV